ncbi:MAG: teichoic acid biosynthesis protein C [Opitutae bacterium]|nr:teichoic acid biosynthesis protein C [Opitutae bacterium]
MILTALALAASPTGAETPLPLPPTGRFDLQAEPHVVFLGQWLHDRRHVPQSFAFDDANGFLYTLQVEGANAAGTFEEHGRRGDLTLTKLARDGRTIAGHMTLRGFGHGVALGIEPVGRDVFLWTEVDSQPNDNASGRGTRIGRFRFESGATLDTASPKIEKFDLMPGAHTCTPSLDLTHGRLALRHVRDGEMRVTLYNLASVASGRSRTPPLREISLQLPFGTVQGWCTYGSYVYVLAGQAYGPKNPPPGNATVWCLDWSTGAVVDHEPVRALADLAYREPEGIAVQVLDGVPRLCIGFGASVSAHDSRRQLSVVAFPKFLPATTP